jgi:hypothetical protein
MYYLYRHIRLDKNEPFYIGIGTIYPNRKTFNSIYLRAFLRCRRSLFWKNITLKTLYKVEIILESENYEFIKQKEIEFIKLYGRKDNGTGCLVNHTDGGEGNTGYIFSEETKEKLRKARKQNLRCGNNKPINQINNFGNIIKSWKNIKEAADFLNVDKSMLSKIVKNKKFYKNYYWQKI